MRGLLSFRGCGGSAAAGERCAGTDRVGARSDGACLRSVGVGAYKSAGLRRGSLLTSLEAREGRCVGVTGGAVIPLLAAADVGQGVAGGGGVGRCFSATREASAWVGVQVRGE